MKTRILIFVVTYNAERTIEAVLKRLPDTLFTDPRHEVEVLIIDDCSGDGTFERGSQIERQWTKCPLTVLKNPRNLGYGGNQKVGYRFAIDHGFHIVALLHGDGQYAPEELPRLLEPLLSRRAAAVFGSRMMHSRHALAGGMPLYKFVGNKILTATENLLVGTRLSEYHSGYRLYSTDALRAIPFERNSDYFDFDTDIIIQLHAAGLRIMELPIPTFYGDEICYVNGLQYAARIVLSCLKYRCQKLGIFYDSKFDLERENLYYTGKFHFVSSHSLALETVQSDEKIFIVGCGPEEVTLPFIERADETSVLDQYLSSTLRKVAKHSWEADLDLFSFEQIPADARFDRIFALDIIEHLRDPEAFLESLRNARSCRDATLVITTPNIAFIVMRLMLLLGSFNYGKRGILDRTHTRLFTLSSLRRALESCGFEILRIRGIPAPVPLALGDNLVGRFFLWVNDVLCRAFLRLFSYQLFVECRPKPTAAHLLERAFQNSADERAKIAHSG